MDKIIFGVTSGCFIFSIWKICFFQGIDLYGLDLTLEAFSQLIKKYTGASLGLIIHIGSVNKEQEAYIRLLQEKVRLEKDDVLWIVNRNIPSYLLVTQDDIFIRATYTDGGPVSLFEIQFKSSQVVIVASDCCERIDGVLLFKNRSVQSLVEKLALVLDNDYLNVKAMQNKQCNYGLAYKTLYSDLFFKINIK